MEQVYIYEEPTEPINIGGVQTANWIARGKVWGKPIFDEEKWSRGITGPNTQRNRIRLRDAVGSRIKKGWRLRLGTQIFVIRDVALSGRTDAIVSVQAEGDYAL